MSTEENIVEICSAYAVQSAKNAGNALQSATNAASSAENAGASALQAKQAKEVVEGLAGGLQAAAETATQKAEEAKTSETNASKSATASATSAIQAKQYADEINAQASSIGLTLVKNGCPINIEERHGAVCKVRVMGDATSRIDCDGVYYYARNSKNTFVLDASLNVVKRYDKVFCVSTFNHDYSVHAHIVTREGKIWTYGGHYSGVIVYDFETGNEIARLANFRLLRNDLTGNFVGYRTTSKTLAKLSLKQEEDGSYTLSAGEEYAMDATLSALSFNSLSPFYLDNRLFVIPCNGHSPEGDKIYTFDTNDNLVPIDKDEDGNIIRFNCTAVNAGATGEQYNLQYASGNPAFSRTTATFTDIDGVSRYKHFLSNGLFVWNISGVNSNGVPTFKQMNYAGFNGIVKGYPWLKSAPDNGSPICAVSVGTSPLDTYYFRGTVLFRNARAIRDNKHTPYGIPYSISFAQTSTGGMYSSACLEPLTATMFSALIGVAPLNGRYSFAMNPYYLSTEAMVMVDLNTPLV